MRSLLVAAVSALALSLLVAPAKAQTDADTTPVLAVGVPAAFAGGFALGLGIADLVSYGIDSPWDDGWAVVDLVVGGITVVVGAVLFAMGFDGRSDSNRYGPGIFAFAWGAHLVGHGIWSLLANDREPPVDLEVAPTEGGARFAVTGPF